MGNFFTLLRLQKKVSYIHNMMNIMSWTMIGWKTNMLKDPRKVVKILEVQQEDVQGPCGVHIEEITHLKDIKE